MKKILFKILILIPALTTLTFSEEYTIEDILAKVKDCSDDIALAEIEYAMGQEDVVMARSEALPQISASTGISYSGQSMMSQKMTSATGSPLDSLTHIHGTAINWSANASQPVITFGRVFSALKIAKTSDTFYETIRDLKKEAYYLNVFLYFKRAYEAQEEVKAYKRSLTHAEKYCDVVRTQFELGSAIKRDTLLATANLYQVKSMLIKAVANHKAAIKNLAQFTEITMPVETTILLHKDIGWFTKIDPVEDKKLVENLELRLKENEVEMRSYQISYERGKLLPSIYFNAGINNSFLIPNVSKAQKDLDEKGAGSDLGIDLEQMLEEVIPDLSDYANPDYINYSLGLQLTWNIFDGRRSIANYKKIKLQHEKSERELKILRDSTEIEVREIFELFETIIKSLEALKLQKEALNDAFVALSDDVNDGFADYLTFLDMEKSLAEVDRQIASLQMQKNLTVAQYRIKTGKSLVKDIK